MYYYAPNVWSITILRKFRIGKQRIIASSVHQPHHCHPKSLYKHTVSSNKHTFTYSNAKSRYLPTTYLPRITHIHLRRWQTARTRGPPALSRVDLATAPRRGHRFVRAIVTSGATLYILRLYISRRAESLGYKCGVKIIACELFSFRERIKRAKQEYCYWRGAVFARFESFRFFLDAIGVRILCLAGVLVWYEFRFKGV